MDDRLVAVNAAVGKRMTPAQVRREHQVLTAAQVNRLLDGTRDDASGALWAALATTGLRLGEALGLKWSDLDRAELRVQRSLRPAVAGDGGVQYHWLPTLKQLGLPKVRLHDLRRSAATLWLEAGLPLKLVQKLLGPRA